MCSLFKKLMGLERPQFYMLSCEKCGRRQLTALSRMPFDVVNTMEPTSTGDTIFWCDHLPTHCEKCGGRLKKQPAPSPIRD